MVVVVVGCVMALRRLHIGVGGGLLAEGKRRGGSWRGACVARTTLGRVGDTPAATAAFTIVEVIVVMAIILVLAGLILGTSGHVPIKAASSPAQAEIQAMSAARAGYKAGEGVSPQTIATGAQRDGHPSACPRGGPLRHQPLTCQRGGDRGRGSL